MNNPATPSTPPPAVPRARRRLRQLWRFTTSTLALIGLISLLRPFTFEITPLISGSMSPTLQGDASSGDWVLAEKISYRFRNPRRWEIVEFHSDDGVQIMKRLAAFPGETVAVRDNQLFINNQPAHKPADAAVVKYYSEGNLNGGRPFSVKSGFYVLGDDSIDSEDSRFEGPLAPDKITARAWLILWPPHRFGWVH